MKFEEMIRAVAHPLGYRYAGDAGDAAGREIEEPRLASVKRELNRAMDAVCLQYISEEIRVEQKLAVSVSKTGTCDVNATTKVVTRQTGDEFTGTDKGRYLKLNDELYEIVLYTNADTVTIGFAPPDDLTNVAFTCVTFSHQLTGKVCQLYDKCVDQTNNRSTDGKTMVELRAIYNQMCDVGVPLYHALGAYDATASKTTLVFYPIPDIASVWRIPCLVIPANMSADVDVFPLPTEYEDVVIAKACVKVAATYGIGDQFARAAARLQFAEAEVAEYLPGALPSVIINYQ